jgi:alanine racemase
VKLDSRQIAEMMELTHPNQEAFMAERIVFDSRKFSAGENMVFFAFRGEHHDGHHFIDELYNKGMRFFVVEDIPSKSYPEALFLQSKNSLADFQKLAQAIREKVNPCLYAITGSNGKTVVKEWMYRLFASQNKTYRSPKSYNSQIGVPLSVWGMPDDTELGIFETGISMPKEMQILAQILKPKGGVFTNIGSAHSENFADQKTKILEKLALFEEAAFIVFPADQLLLSKEIKSFSRARNIQTFDWSQEKGKAKAWLEIKERKPGYCGFIFHYQGKKLNASIPFGDEASIQNATNALFLALIHGIPRAVIIQTLSGLSPVEMRLEMKNGHQNALLINDAYNSDFESLRVALNFLKEHGKEREQILVLSDFFQSGLKSKALSKALSKVVSEYPLAAIYAIGPQLQQHPLKVNGPIYYFESTEDFLNKMHAVDWQNKAVLLKGARSFAFERIDQQLALQRHETVLEVHLNRLVHNLNYYRERLPAKTKLMVMVKAFAYGSGIEEVARVLAFHGVDYLAVAYIDEGVALRKAGIEIPIMVLNPESSSLDSLIDYELEPEVYSFKKLREIAAISAKHESEIKVHLKLETGMNRLGFSTSDLPKLIQRLKEEPQLKVVAAFSHLAASNDPAEADFTRGQIEVFTQMSGQLAGEFPNPFLRHIANTGGIESFPEAYFDMVRLGIGLYGIAAHPEEQAQLLPVAELKATVSQIKDIAKGDTVGYGRSWKATEFTRIAIISIGYADGFARSLSNGKGQVLIKGKRYPVVGLVCMDMCMVDIAMNHVEEGDEVLIFGEDLPVQEMAKAMDTIAYEVLTGISSRVKRVYFDS